MTESIQFELVLGSVWSNFLKNFISQFGWSFKPNLNLEF
jgi:hypothetical protein